MTAHSQLSQHLTPSHWMTPSSPERSRPDSPDVFIVGNTDDDDPEEETISVTGFSKSDTEEVCVAAACEKAHVGDTLYATWHDNQI